MNGWLSPDAEFYPCRVGRHHEMAEELIPEGNTETWVTIYRVGAFSELPLTQAQITWLQNSLKTNNDETYCDMIEFLLEKQEDFK